MKLLKFDAPILLAFMFSSHLFFETS